MANQDRFIVNIQGFGYAVDNTPLDVILRQTQLDYSSYHISPYSSPSYPSPTTAGALAYQFNVTVDDVFQGDAADVQTVKDQFDAVMRRYFVSYDSEIVSAQVIPAHQVVTSVNPNTGHVTTQATPPISPANPNQKNWFDRTFFNGAGALTGVGIGVLCILGVVVVTQRER